MPKELSWIELRRFIWTELMLYCLLVPANEVVVNWTASFLDQSSALPLCCGISVNAMQVKARPPFDVLRILREPSREKNDSLATTRQLALRRPFWEVSSARDHFLKASASLTTGEHLSGHNYTSGKTLQDWKTEFACRDYCELANWTLRFLVFWAALRREVIVQAGRMQSPTTWRFH